MPRGWAGMPRGVAEVHEAVHLMAGGSDQRGRGDPKALRIYILHVSAHVSDQNSSPQE